MFKNAKNKNKKLKWSVNTKEHIKEAKFRDRKHV